MFMGPICIVIIGTFIFNACSYFHRIMVLETSRTELEKQLVVLKEKEESLSSDIEKLKDPEYIAKYARENYMYSKDGEYIIKVEDSSSDVVKEDSSFDYWVVVFFSSFILLVVIVYIVFRKKEKDII